MTREEAAHNLMGVKKTAIRWEGEAVGADPVFETFASDEDGIRAGALCLLAYQRHHGCRTALDFITRFAPSSDHNPTLAYARFVAALMGEKLGRAIDAERTPLDLTDLRELESFAAAVIHFENGHDAAPPQVIRSACARAVRSVAAVRQAAGPAARPLAAPGPAISPATGAPSK